MYFEGRYVTSFSEIWEKKRVKKGQTAVSGDIIELEPQKFVFHLIS